jgi:hypothetical protein
LIQTHVTKDTQVSNALLRDLSKSFPPSRSPNEAKSSRTMESEGSLGDTVPTGAEAVITGIDVLVMKGDKIGAVYVFLDPPKK